MIGVLRDPIESADSLNFYKHSVIRRNRADKPVYQPMMETEFACKAAEELRDQI